MSSQPDGHSLTDTDLSMFPYETPRDAQLDGMDALGDVVDDNGFLLLEGACGTGKTVLSLVPLLNYVRSPSSDFQRIFVITSVKQQRWAFNEAVTDINNGLDAGEEAVSALMLSGKADVSPFVQNGVIEPEAVYDEMEVLHDNTRELIDQLSGGDKLSQKRESARTLYTRAETDYGEFPYGDEIPYYDRNGEQVEYDPYYARHLAALYTREMEEGSSQNDERVVPFRPSSEGVITPDKLVDLAAQREGTSPHGVMSDLLDEVEVIIGNYYHVFDPMTAERMTGDLFDDETLVVVDEAHNLVPDVRDLLGVDTSFMGLDGAANEVEEVVGWITGESDAAPAVKSRAQELFTGASATTDEMEATADLLHAVHDRLGERITQFIEDEQGPEWWMSSEFEDLQLSLRDPEKMEEDMLSQWISLNPKLSKATAKDARDVLHQVYQIRQQVYESQYGQKRLPNSSLRSAGEVITNWVANDNTAYFRQVTLEERAYEPNSERTSFEWQEYYRATLEVNNCIPRNEISAILNEFGGGVLMSATLKPFDVFEQITGLDLLKSTHDRRLERRRYGLPFPEENRISLGVEATDFRWRNRGSPFTQYGNPNLDNDCREEYAEAILSVVETTPGNVLVAMPSYSEAEWAGGVIKRKSDSVSASNVIIDESSSDKETQRMKRRFFSTETDGTKRVLVTGAHGTLIEGVDYDDEKLHGVIVCGVPLQSTHEPYQQAIETAYDARFGDENGFEYAFSLPAVYKARQTIGRVIRSDTDLGARALVDKRYTDDNCWGNVRSFFPEDELADFQKVEDTGTLENRLNAFWKFHDK